jgi:hypothetical protein
MLLSSSGGWKMAVNGVGIPSAPTPGTEWWREDIWLHRRSLSEEERADPTWRVSGNDGWWVQFFNARRDAELQSTEWLIGSPTSWNREGAPDSGACRGTLSPASSTASSTTIQARDAAVPTAPAIALACAEVGVVISVASEEVDLAVVLLLPLVIFRADSLDTGLLPRLPLHHAKA